MYSQLSYYYQHRQYKLEYQKNYYQKNKEKIKNYYSEYYQKKKDKLPKVNEVKTENKRENSLTIRRGEFIVKFD